MIRGMLAFFVGMALAVAAVVAATVMLDLAKPGGPFAATGPWPPEGGRDAAADGAPEDAAPVAVRPVGAQSASAARGRAPLSLRIPPAIVIPKALGPPAGGAIIREGNLAAPTFGGYADRLDVPAPPDGQIHVIESSGTGGRRNLADLTAYANRAARRRSVAEGEYQGGIRVVAVDSLARRDPGYKAKEQGKGPAPASTHHILVIQNRAGLFEAVRLQDGDWEDVTQSRKCHEALKNAKASHRVEGWMLKTCGVADVKYAPRGAGRTAMRTAASRANPAPNSGAAADSFGLAATNRLVRSLPQYRAPVPTPTPKPKRGESYAGASLPKQASEPGMWTGTWPDSGSWVESN